MVRAACRVVDAAAKAFIDGWRASGAPETGALQGERAARAMAAQDVRTLVSLNDGRTLVPFQGEYAKTPGPLVGYIAVKLAGYWADMLITAGEPVTEAARRSDAALDRMIATARPGARMSELHSVAVDALKPLQLHPMLGGSVGRGIGLSLHEGPEFRDNEARRSRGRRDLCVAGRCGGRAGRVCPEVRYRACSWRRTGVAGTVPRLGRWLTSVGSGWAMRTGFSYLGDFLAREA